MRHKDFCAFIITHGRPDNQVTYRRLMDRGYDGPLYFVCDDEDKTVPQMIEKFGEDKVLVFSKKDVKQYTDVCDNFGNMKVILYGRNVCFELAKKLGYRYFLELDDDYSSFGFRHDENLNWTYIGDRHIADTIDATLDFFKACEQITTVAWSQGGDHFGPVTTKPKRKAMNTFFCDTERPFLFKGTLNEDVNAYTEGGRRGQIFMTIMQYYISQETTQASDGGLTEMYLEVGTYVKSFYSIMCCPSAVKIAMMGTEHPRIHHRVDWNKCAVKIVREEHRK